MAPQIVTSSRALGPAESAKTLLTRVAKTGRRIEELPVDLEAITSDLGLNVYYASFSDPNISGMLILDPGRVPKGVEPGANGTVFLKRGEYPPRSRFTLAHEVGHLEMGHHDGGVITDFFRGRADGYTDPNERDANAFAAELLMPELLFRQLWESGASEEDLAVMFGVSPTAASVRAQALRLEGRYAV